MSLKIRIFFSTSRSSAIRLLKSSLAGMTGTLSENLVEYDLFKMQAAIAGVLFILLLAVGISSIGLERQTCWIVFFEVVKVVSLASTSFIEEQHQVLTREKKTLLVKKNLLKGAVFPDIFLGVPFFA